MTRPEPREYDVIVVGGRAAGAATALQLARRGLEVLVVDRARRGSDTLSTHALMRTGVLQLRRWGLLDDVIASGAPPLGRTIVHYGDEAVPIDLAPTGGVDALYAPRRTVLDPILVEAAEREGVQAEFGVRVTDLLRDHEGRVTGIEAVDDSGRNFTARSRLTIGADGLQSTVARRANATIYRSGTSSSALFYSYWSGMEVEGYEWFFRPGLSGGIIPTNDERACVWVGAPTEGFRRELFVDGKPSIERAFARLNHPAAARLETGRAQGFRAFRGRPGFFRQAWGPGWALVGDSGYFKDPLSAHGISDAFRDAELLARAIASVFAGDAREHEALAAYQRTRDELSHVMFSATDAVASYQWDLSQLRGLLLEISAAIRNEFETLLLLEEASTLAA